MTIAERLYQHSQRGNVAPWAMLQEILPVVPHTSTVEEEGSTITEIITFEDSSVLIDTYYSIDDRTLELGITEEA